jgi:hypothetical protein
MAAPATTADMAEATTQQPLTPEVLLAGLANQVQLLTQQMHVLTAQQQTTPPAPTPLKLKPNKPDTYQGQDKDRLRIHDWTYQLDTFYESSHISSDLERINFAVTLLRGPALRWWRNVDPAQRPPTWADFKACIQAYFLPLGSDNSARNQLERLHQRGSVSAYTDQFRAVADLIPSMGEDEKRNA